MNFMFLLTIENLRNAIMILLKLRSKNFSIEDFNYRFFLPSSELLRKSFCIPPWVMKYICLLKTGSDKNDLIYFKNLFAPRMKRHDSRQEKTGC